MDCYLQQHERQQLKCQYAYCHWILPMKKALAAVYERASSLKEVAVFHL